MHSMFESKDNQLISGGWGMNMISQNISEEEMTGFGNIFLKGYNLIWMGSHSFFD